MTDHSLAFGARGAGTGLPGDPEQRRRVLRSAVSWVLVGIIHVVLLMAFLIRPNFETEKVGTRGPVETILDLSYFHDRNAPPVQLIKPEVENVAPPEYSTAPVIVLPPKPIPQQQKNAPSRPGDVLESIGEALACGASNFEYLPQGQREKCMHQPWIARKLPNGTIVLEAQPRLATPDTGGFHISGADQMRRQMETSQPCPVVQSAPCLDNIFHPN